MFSRSSRNLVFAAASALALVMSVAVPNAEAREGAQRGRAAHAPHSASRTARPQVPRGDRSIHTERQRTADGSTSHSEATGRNGRTATRDTEVVNDRDAGTRTRDVTYTGPNGGTRTVNDVTSRTEDGHLRSTVTTDAQGRTATRDAVVTNDAEAQTRTRDVTYTGRGGETRTGNTVTSRTDTGYTRDSTFTNAQGETATRNAVVVNDSQAGTRTRDVVYTGPDGRTRTVNDVTARTEDDYTRDSVFTNAQGETATRSAVAASDPDSGLRTREVTYTGVNGGVASVNEVTQRTDSGYTLSTVVTGPNGNTGTRQVTVSCDEDADNCTKDVTVNDAAGGGS